MRFVMFYHSLVSDWNHGNAHFLRGVAAELGIRGHEVTVFEPRESWSRNNLLAEHGPAALEAFARRFPSLTSQVYDPATLDLDRALDGADVVLVHEWNDVALVRALGDARRQGSFRLFFHDTHHRGVSDPDAISRLDLSNYDAALVFGEVLRDLYLARGWCRRAYTWHEAADTRTFRPMEPVGDKAGDVVWIGNWGDDERTQELEEFLLGPVRALGVKATVYGVRYPATARAALEAAGVTYGGWLPNFEVPDVLSRHRMTVHVPRRFYTRALPGIPTIRPFEALACGIPLISAWWEDREGLFKVGRDYLVARDGDEMKSHIAWLLANPDEARALGADGRQTVLARHTCAHRVNELFGVIANLAAQDVAGACAAMSPAAAAAHQARVA